MNIYDVAEKAGVSIATVSRVLNSSEHISEKTRRRVLEVMESSGYTPNAFARGLGLNSMRMIGVMCTDITDAYYSKAVGQIENLFRKKNYDTVLCCTGNDFENKKKYLRYLINKKVDSVILIGSAFNEKDNSYIKEAARQIPIIIINGYVNAPNVYCFVCDEKKAMEDNVKLLLRAGYDKILYLYNTATYSGLQKLEGYKRGYTKENTDKRLIVKTDKDISAVKSAVKRLYNSGTEFNAVLTSEDAIAAAAIKAAEELKISVPIIGFNNSNITEYTTPTITSVDNMIDRLCDMAVNCLESLENNKSVPSKTVISGRIVERESFKSTF